MGSIIGISRFTAGSSLKKSKTSRERWLVVIGAVILITTAELATGRYDKKLVARFPERPEYHIELAGVKPR